MRVLVCGGKPDLVVAFPGGRGTANMIEQAEQAGVPVRRIT
jgi:ABC-type Fe3+-hydroxamate transport system substrate-binding protein